MKKLYKIQPTEFPKITGLISGVQLKKVIKHNDERGYFEEIIRVSDDFFKEGFGQLSHSFMHKGVLKAWHIHLTQIDWWYVAKGNLHVALYDNRKDSPTFGIVNTMELGDSNDNFVLKIPSGVAHGCKVTTESSELFYVTSKTYNTKEEGRIPHDDPEIGYDWMNSSK
jgi:dTDP-4-dehydrorhamnose 3,5-epimerase